MLTETLPTPTGTRPQRLSSPRPDDADGIRLFTAECAGHVWPDHGDHPPYTVNAETLRMPWHGIGASPLRYAAGGGILPLEHVQHQAWVERQNQTADHGEYARALSWHFLALSGSAALVASVTEDPYPWSQPDLFGDPMWGMHSPRVFHDGTPVRLESWAEMRRIDPASLWMWAAADRETADARRDRRQREAVLETTFPGALACARALHDALQLLLPDAVEPTPTAPTTRRNSWR